MYKERSMRNELKQALIKNRVMIVNQVLKMKGDSHSIHSNEQINIDLAFSEIEDMLAQKNKKQTIDYKKIKRVEKNLEKIFLEDL